MYATIFGSLKAGDKFAIKYPSGMGGLVLFTKTVEATNHRGYPYNAITEDGKLQRFGWNDHVQANE